MTLSDTARRILTVAAQHPLRLAAPPEKLPVAAARPVLTSLLKQGLVEAYEAPETAAHLRWSQPDGTATAVRITGAGMAAIGTARADTSTSPDEGASTGADLADTPQEPASAPLVPPATPEAPWSPQAQKPASGHLCALACAMPPTAS